MEKLDAAEGIVVQKLCVDGEDALVALEKTIARESDVIGEDVRTQLVSYSPQFAHIDSVSIRVESAKLP